jgi:hypothetical protein
MSGVLMIKLTKHSPQYHPRHTPMGDLEYLINLWDAVCEEQDHNDYDWEKTKEVVLSDWDREGMTLDFWIAYMRENILWAAKDVVRESKTNSKSSAPKH